MAAGNQWKHLEFTLTLSKRFFSPLKLKTLAWALLSTYWLLRTRKHHSNRYFRARNNLPGNNADVTHCGKTQCSIFKPKVVYRAEDRPANNLKKKKVFRFIDKPDVYYRRHFLKAEQQSGQLRHHVIKTDQSGVFPKIASQS